MKSPLRLFLVVICVGLIAFILGYFVGDTPGNHAVLESAPTKPAASPADTASRIETNAAQGGGSDAQVALSGERTRVRTFELLGEPNRIIRMRQLCELLAQLTPENWRGAIDGFAVQTKTEGRWQVDEWNLMIERVGEVAGAEALAEALQTGNASDLFRARKLLTGFAAGDAKAAMAWYREQPPERQQLLLNDLLAGLGRSDAKQAMALILDQPRETWEPNATSIISGAIQTGGFRAADDLFAAIRHSPNAPDPLKSKVLYDLIKWQMTTGVEPAKLMDWLDPYLAMAGPNAVKETVTLAAKADPVKALAWLDQRASRMVPPQSSSAYAIVAGIMQAQAPQQFATWMNANADHPHRDVMAQTAAAARLRSGQTNEAMQWKETIRDPQTREALDRAIRDATSVTK
ncbi:MAG: hypothetical protein H7Y43_12615 [Akkermansiaceae bacterium]|nr:hypothetical protein [Verrucomicrobiales bacterium]